MYSVLYLICTTIQLKVSSYILFAVHLKHLNEFIVVKNIKR